MAFDFFRNRFVSFSVILLLLFSLSSIGSQSISKETEDTNTNFSGPILPENFNNGLTTSSTNATAETSSSLASTSPIEAIPSMTSQPLVVNAISKLIEDTQASATQTSLTQIEKQKFSTLGSSINYIETSCGKPSIIPVDCSYKPIGNPTKRVLLVGDSKMAMLAPIFISFAKNHSWQVDTWIMLGCKTIGGYKVQDLTPACKARIDWIGANLKPGKYDIIIDAQFPIIQGTPEIQTRVAQDLSMYIKATKKFIYYAQSPSVTAADTCVKKDFSYSPTCTSFPDYFNPGGIKMKSGVEQLGGIFIDFFHWICTDSICPIANNGVFTYRDGDHTTLDMENKITPAIYESLLPYI